MGYMQIRVGIWFFWMGSKGEVTGSRAGRAIIMTHMKATFISTFFTSLALRVGREIREREGGQGVAEGKTLRVTTCSGNERKSGRRESKREGHEHRDGAKEGRHCSVLAISPSVTAPWLYGALPVMVLRFN